MEAAYAKDREPPQWYRDEPELLPGEAFYLASFWDLSTERYIGMAVGPIPWSKRREYAIYQGLEPCLIRPFIAIMARLDIWFLEHVASEQKLGQSKMKSTSK